MPKLTYNPALDGLRALAALAVVGFHARWGATPGGFVGVDVFFVLSGFLITSLLRAEATVTGTLSLARFWLRRAARLWPALLVVTATVAVSAPLFWPGASPIEELFLSLLFLSDYSQALFGAPDIMQHSWSLSVEMQFYLLWPTLVIATRSVPPRTLGRLLLGLFVAATLWRFVGIHALGDWHAVYYRGDTRLSGLILGGLLAVSPLRRDMLSPNSGLYGLAALGLCVMVLRWEAPLSLSVGTLAVELAAFVVIAAASQPGDRLNALLASRPLVAMGLWSYSLYLWHYPVVRVLREFGGQGPALLAGALLISIPLAALTYYAVERPVLRLARLRTAARTAVPAE